MTAFKQGYPEARISCILLFVGVQVLLASGVVVDNGFRKYDTFGNALHAHGGGVLKDGDYYYWFGENRNYNDSDTFFAVSCYRSRDLKTWEFRNHVLRRDMDDDLNYAKIERAKVIYNPVTKKYVMWMHKEWGDNYNEARAAVASCDTIDGDYAYRGSFRPLGYMSRDCTLFVDDDGSAYFLSAANNNADLHLYRLTDDFLGPAYLVTKIWVGQSRESPCLFKRDGVYFIVSSGTTGWNPNQAKYGYAADLAGPWSALANLGSSSTSFRTQPHYVLTIQGNAQTSFVYMGDRWARAWGDYTDHSEYIWMPLEFPNGTSLAMQYYDALSLDVASGSVEPVWFPGWRKFDDADSSITYDGNWGTWPGNPGYFGTEHYSETAGSQVSFAFTGTKARYYGFKRNDLGRADIYVDSILVDTVDCYASSSQYDVLLYETPQLPEGQHTLAVRVTGAQNPSSMGYEIIVDAFSNFVASALPAPELNEAVGYRIINRHSGKVLTIGGPDTYVSNATLQQYVHANADYQKWRFESQPDNTLLIRSVHSGLLADVENGSLLNGAWVVQNAGGGTGQKWRLLDCGAGSFKVENAASAKVMDIQNGSFDDGAQDIQYDDNGGANQQWMLMPCEEKRNIWLEAEVASTQPGFVPFVVEPGGALPEDSCIVVPAGTGQQSGTPAQGVCEYSFTIDTHANVRVRLLAHCPSMDHNEFTIRLDADPYESLVLQEHPTDFVWGHWAARPIAAGPHTLSVAWREDGAKLDKILVEVEPVLRTDYDSSRHVDILDFAILSHYWLQDAAAYDIAPPGGDEIIDLRELLVLSDEWLR